MELYNENEFRKYIEDNYELFIELDSSGISTELSNKCDSCQRDAFLKVHTERYSNTNYSSPIPFVNILLECPTCKRKAFILMIQLIDQIPHENEGGGTSFTYKYKYYKIGRIPVAEEEYLNENIPDKYITLRKTVTEANFCLSNSKYIASAILFRRAIQILAKDILGGQGKTLYNQLEWLIKNPNKLNIDLNEIFHDNSNIIKDIGNQGAHPDDDVTLHDFSRVDAYGLYDLFISIVHEVFVKPAKLKELQENLKKSRKLK